MYFFVTKAPTVQEARLKERIVLIKITRVNMHLHAQSNFITYRMQLDYCVMI